MRRVRIKVDDLELAAEFNDSEVATAIWDALPLKVKGSLWGDEIYFRIPVEISNPDKKAVVQEGDLGYWEPGSAFCIFYGPTPASHGNEIRPASPVNVVGRIIGGVTALKTIRRSPAVLIERQD